MAHQIPKLVYGSVSPTEIEFTYPPESDEGEHYEVISKTAESISGVQQVSTSYTEATRKVRLSFLTEALKSSLKTFFTSHAGLGKPFKWYPDKDEADYEWYALGRRQFQPKKIAPTGSNAFIWELDLEFRRVFDLVGEFDMAVSILNNQASPVSIAGLLFTHTVDSAMIICYELRRKTDDNEAVATGHLHLVYRKNSAQWEISDVRHGDDCGVTFSITSAGQVQYISDDMSGDNYEGELVFKEIDLND